MSDDERGSSWWNWSLIPGLNWIAWLHLALRTGYSRFAIYSILYGLPWALFAFRLRTRGILFLGLFSWLIGLAHTFRTQSQLRAARQRELTSAAQEELEEKQPESLEQRLLRVARDQDGELTLAQAAHATGDPVKAVRQKLEDFAEDGVVEIHVTDDGAFSYRFPGLAPSRSPKKHMIPLNNIPAWVRWGALGVLVFAGTLAVVYMCTSPPTP